MTIQIQCACGARLTARDEFSGRRAVCPSCGKTLQVVAKALQPDPATAASTESQIGTLPVQIAEFLDPPAAVVDPNEEKRPVFRRMFEALLDPRSIQWMLMIGGGLGVLGLVIWLVSLGIFKNPVVLALAMGAGTLAILGAGWYLVLKTRFRVAGQALTFLGCVIAPLNLWFYHAQGLITLEEQLWIGGVVCCLLYAATVYVLRDPLFMYAVEGGVTLTVLLLLAELGVVSDPTALSLFFMAMGLISIHAERAFPPDEGEFTRRRFGMPLFWSGHAQIGASLIILLGTQALAWLSGSAANLFTSEWVGNMLTDNLLTESHLLGGGLWLAGTYVYLYSDIVVRRVGVYIYLAAFSLLWAIVTLVGWKLEAEGVILVLALVALGANLLQRSLAKEGDQLSRVAAPVGLVLSGLPLLIGWILHVGATSSAARTAGWPSDSQTGWFFVVVMLVVALSTRASAWLSRRTSPGQSGVYFFFSAAAVILAAAGLLRLPRIGLTEWYEQAPLLMLIPIGYIMASRFWRGRFEERPLGWVAHTAAAVILIHVLMGSLEMFGSMIRPVTGVTENLLLGLVFAEAAVFYTLAGLFRRRSVNAYFAAAAACGALWQFMGFWDIPDEFHTILFAVLGIASLAAARSLGIEQIAVYRGSGEKGLATRGRGLTAFQSGNAILLVAFLAALLQGLTRLAFRDTDWPGLSALVMTTIASIVAVWLVRRGGWRRLYMTSAVALAGLTFLTLTVEWLIELSGWEKLEIFCVVVGLAMLIASHLARFRETEDSQDDMVSFGLFLGSALATLPLLVAVIHHRFFVDAVSLLPTYDDFGILAITILMLVSGLGWQIKSTTVFGGGSLTLYLIMVVTSIAYQPQVAIGVYLAIGGALVFAVGIALSIYREKLLKLPERIAKREGFFRIMNWR